MSSRFSAVRWLLGAVVMLSGCATVRQQPVLDQMYEYSYPRPLDEVWPEVRKFVSEEGFPPLESPGQYVVISDWVTSFNENRVASGAERVYVRGVPLNRANSEIRIFRETRMTGNKARVGPTDLNNGSSLMVLTADDENPLDYDPVHLTHQLKSGSGMGLGEGNKSKNRVFTRAVDLEWKLLQRLDAQEARRLEAQVDQEKP